MAKAKVEYQKLNPKFKKRWVAALRSGEWEQTRRRVSMPKSPDLQSSWRNPETNKTSYFCCLGVAAKLAEPDTFIGIETTDNACKKFGLTDGDTIQALVDLNDTKEWGFKQIATWVEKNL